MRIAVFSAKNYDKETFTANKPAAIQLEFIKSSISPDYVRTISCERTYDAVSVFYSDKVTDEVIVALRECGVKAILSRCAGSDNIDIQSAKRNDIHVCRVPTYSTAAVAEHSVSLLLALNRQLHLAYERVSIGNFSIDGLVGMDIHGKTIGIVGTTRIGQQAARIFKGFGCKVIAFDKVHDNEFADSTGVEYVSMDTLLSESHVVSLHTALTPETYHLINAKNIKKMRDGAIIINTGRAALVSNKALIEALVSGKLRGAGLDTVEGESEFSFTDRSLDCSATANRDLCVLRKLNNVILTSRQAFLTKEALKQIAKTTFHNAMQLKAGGPLDNLVEE